MRFLHILTACAVALSFPVHRAKADAEKTIPIFTLTLKSYGDFAKLAKAAAKAVDPANKENPLRDIEKLIGGKRGFLDRGRPIHVALYLNGMLEPLVAALVPTDDIAALKKTIKPKKGDIVEELPGGYALLIANAETSLEENIAAARALDPKNIKAKHTAEFTARFDEPTRKMLKGVLAMGRLEIMQQGDELGDDATAEMFKDALAVYFDMFEGFVDGMGKSSVTMDLIDDGLRFGFNTSARKGSTFAGLIARSPMPPAPIARNYRADSALSISGRIAEVGEPLSNTLGKMAALTTKFGGGEDGGTSEKMIALMGKMAPMYFSFGYDYQDELTANGIYEFTKDTDVASLYKELIEVGVDVGKMASGEGKLYRDFDHERKTIRDGKVKVDHFVYRLGDALPPNPLLGDRMDIEYAHLGQAIFFAMGEEGIAPMLERREPDAVPAFLKPGENTVMIGHLDILSLMGSVARIEITHPGSDTTFIADPGKKGGEKNPSGKEGDPAAGSKILMRASVDGALHFDLHVPLSLLRTLARLN